MSRTRLRLPLPLAIGAAVAVAILTAAWASAQRGRTRAPRPIAPDARVEWSAFVSSYRDRPSQRTPIGAEPGRLAIPIQGWECSYTAPQRTHLDAGRWSEVRAIECAHGDARVSTTGACQVTGATWSARAAVLSLATRGSEGRVEVTLDCTVHP
jgi:hypothetical protein